MNFDMCEFYLNVCIKANMQHNRLREGLKGAYYYYYYYYYYLATELSLGGGSPYTSTGMLISP
jgi:hypothetical protein